MTTILVTGGCGFIGSHFVELLLGSTDWRVVNLDKLTYAGNPQNLAGVRESERYRFVKGDIADRKCVEELFDEERPDLVANFAAESHVDRSILDASVFLRTNVEGTHTLLEAARKHKARRFLQVSTDEVYGDIEGKESCREDASLLPSSPYAASKAAADLLALAYQRTHDVPLLISRSSNVYGPRQFPEKLIPLLIRKALAGEALPIYGDGEQKRHWLYVTDNCRALLALMAADGLEGIYNVGHDEQRSNLEIVQLVCAALSKETGLREDQFTNLVTLVADRPGHDRRYAMDSTKVARETGWAPTTSFDAGLTATVRWYLANPSWAEGAMTGENRQFFDKVYNRRWENS